MHTKRKYYFCRNSEHSGILMVVETCWNFGGGGHNIYKLSYFYIYNIMAAATRP